MTAHKKGQAFCELSQARSYSPAAVAAVTSIETRADTLRERYIRALIAHFKLRGLPTLSHHNGVREGDPLLTHGDRSSKRYTRAMLTSGYELILYEGSERERYTLVLIGPDGNVKESPLYTSAQLTEIVRDHIEIAGCRLEKINAFTKRIYALDDTGLRQAYMELQREDYDSADMLDRVLSTAAIAARKSHQDFIALKKEILHRRIKERFFSALSRLFAEDKTALSRLYRTRKQEELRRARTASWRSIGKTLSGFFALRWGLSEFERAFEEYLLSYGEHADRARAELYCEMVDRLS